MKNKDIENRICIDSLQHCFDWSEQEYEAIESLMKQSVEEYKKELLKKLPKKMSMKKVHKFYKRDEEKYSNNSDYDYSGGEVNAHNGLLEEITKLINGEDSV